MDILSMVSQLAGDVAERVDTALEAVPATLVAFWSEDKPIPFAVIPFMFKPTELSFSKSANWSGPKKKKGDKLSLIEDDEEGSTPLRNAPKVDYKGSGAESLTLKLFLDSSAAGMLGVAGYVKILKFLVKRPPLMKKPPLVMFVWGLTMSEMSYVESMSYTYTLFAPSGKPLRADVSLTLKEMDMGWLSLLSMNPTSRSEARKTWVVVEGQTLDWIAHQEYSDPAQWRHIAKTNNLMNPMELRPGQVLKLTPLP